MKDLNTGKLKAIFDEEFENIFIGITIKEFNNMGFDFGDSISILFSNGLQIKDIPYYSGYYSGVEELMLCGYPGDPYIKLARNCGNPTWFEFNMHDNDTIEISLFQKGKYKEIEELFSLEYSDNTEDFENLEAFSNFRELKGGTIKPHFFYRSASPCDNWHKRGTYTDKLIEKYQIKCVLNLSNSIQKYESFTAKDDFDSYYYNSLYESGNVLLLLLNVNYRADDFKIKIANGLYKMTKHDGPVLIHCAEGKDRTGFVCALIMSLAKASYKDIIDDYMLTYKHYYNITLQNQPKKYKAISDNIYDFLYSMCQATPDIQLSDLDLYNSAINYLKQGGLTTSQIKEIEKFINI